VKRYRLKRQDGFAGLVHRLNFVFEPSRGADRAELARGVYQDWYGVRLFCCPPTNARDEGPGPTGKGYIKFDINSLNESTSQNWFSDRFSSRRMIRFTPAEPISRSLLHHTEAAPTRTW